MFDHPLSHTELDMPFDAGLADLHVDPAIDPHLHLVDESDALDLDGDSFSDAAEIHLGTDPSDPGSHPTVDASWLTPSDPGVIDRDTDLDGYSDRIEALMSTDPDLPASHPEVVEAHHFPAGSDTNLTNTVDLFPPPMREWRLP